MIIAGINLPLVEILILLQISSIIAFALVLRGHLSIGQIEADVDELIHKYGKPSSRKRRKA